MARNALGRGLGALIRDPEVAAPQVTPASTSVAATAAFSTAISVASWHNHPAAEHSASRLVAVHIRWWADGVKRTPASTIDIGDGRSLRPRLIESGWTGQLILRVHARW